MKLKVEITEKHFFAGLQNNCEECPTALAVTEALEAVNFSPEYQITVAPDSVTLYTPAPPGQFIQSRFASGRKVIARADLPEFMTHWIKDFDAGRPVQPVIFHLEFEAL